MCLAVPGRIERIEGDDPLARRALVTFGGVAREVALALVPEAACGDWVLVHAGFAIACIDEAEARRTLAELEALGEDSAP